MAVIALNGSASGNTGALAADTLIYIATGKVMLSTDAGTTRVPFDAGDKVVFSSGLTVHYFNDTARPAELRTMAF